IGLAALAGLLAGPTHGGDDAAKKELNWLQGWWTYDLGELRHEGGKQVVVMPADAQKRVQIEGDKFRYRQDEKGPWQWEATIALDPAAKPKQITLTRTVKEGG